MPDYLPRREGDRVAWAGRLAGALVASPEDYGVTLADATAYADLHAAAAEAWRVSRTPSTRTPTTIRAKDQSLAVLITQTRSMVGKVRGYLGLREQAATRATRLSTIGLKVPNKSRRVLRVPGRLPRVAVYPTVKGLVEVVVVDPVHSARRAKPRGVGGLMVYSRWRKAEGPWTRWMFEGGQTQMRFELAYPKGAQAGDQLEVAVRWASPTCKLGPASTPAGLVLPPKYAMRMDEGRRAA